MADLDPRGSTWGCKLSLSAQVKIGEAVEMLSRRPTMNRQEAIRFMLGCPCGLQYPKLQPPPGWLQT